MFRASQIVALAVGCLLLTSSAAFAQKVGDKIIVIVEDADLKVQSKVVETVSCGTHLEVERVNGDWYWVTYDRSAGWVRRKDVIPFDRGIDFFTDLIRKKPTVKRLVRRAEIWSAKGDHERALRDLNEAVRLDPSDWYAYGYRSLEWDAIGELDKAIADATEIIRLVVNENKDRRFISQRFAARGALWRDKRDYQQAVADFGEAIRVDPRNANAYHYRAVIWSGMGEYDRAIADADESIRLNPAEALAWGTRGFAWQGKDQVDKAIGDYNEAIRLDPTDARLFNNRGNAWNDKGRFDRAIADFSEAIRLDSTCARAYVGRANALATSGKTSSAIDDLTEAINLDPRSAMAYRERGVLWYSKLNFDRAILDLTESIEIEPTALSYSLRAMAWQLKGEIGNALDDYSELNRLAPNVPLGYVNSAWLRATSPDPKYRNGKVAVESAIKACELTNWTDGEYLVTLAAAYAEAGDFEKAVATQEKARDLAPDSDKAEYQTRVELYKSGKPYRQELKSPPTHRVRGKRSASATERPTVAGNRNL